MSVSIGKMNSLRPESAAAMTAHRREAVRLAKSQEKAVFDKCKRSNQVPPGYTFDELIGKGSFGRVYKGRQSSTAKVVAIKVLDIDEADFHAFGDQKDEQIRDFNREIQILRQAQESGAENLNHIIEALPVHSQLWLICEYCPGGSVKTLMRATGDRLAEKYLVVVARELGKALKGLHQAGIMHRDVKAANVLIHENGGIQLCDFGVAATLEGSKDKRRTFIGTLHWMPPELYDDKLEYSDEVDVWEYGCTIYECALGRPPNSDLRERQQLKLRMRRLKQSISLPEKEKFSDDLRSLVRFALTPDAASRPSMIDIMQHEYLVGTEETHPTSSLSELVQLYYAWLFSGGQRVSLFMPGGAAAAAEVNDNQPRIIDEWNFSMTQDFEKRISTILEIPDLSECSYLGDPEDLEDQSTPRLIKDVEAPQPQEMTAVQKANFEKRVQRGEGLANLFDHSKPAYEYKAKTDFVPVATERRTSDLPFRAMAEERPSSIASNVIDLGDFDSDDYAVAAPRSTDIQTTYAETAAADSKNFRLADAATLRAKRADSKGPKDTSRTRRASDTPELPQGTATQDFASAQEDWTVRDSKLGLQGDMDATRTVPGMREKVRQTMEWSFAGAMSELTEKPVHDLQESPKSGPQISVTEATYDRHAEERAKKHATLEWSFASAMANIGTDPPPLETTSSEMPKRPAPLLRTMTQPVTHSEVQDAYDDSLPRPDTALSFAYSETSTTSTDFDPFGLERHSVMDDSVASEIDEIGAGSFYTARGRHVPAMSLNGPGPEDRMSQDLSYMRGRSLQQDDFPGGTITAANIRTMHRRGVGSQASQSSADSRRSAKSNNLTPATPQTVAGGPGPEKRNSASSSGTRISSFGGAGFPDPKPPSFAALSYDADSALVERELERLLEEFQGALGVAGDMLSEELRGRGRDRDRPRRVNGFGPPILGESGSEWEDEDGHDD